MKLAREELTAAREELMATVAAKVLTDAVRVRLSDGDRDEDGSGGGGGG